MTDFPTRFDHVQDEPKIYAAWLESGGFSPDMASSAEARSILMPPPNANGPIHIGHAFELVSQDAMIRYWRLRGYKTLWQPGADHAGFETQIVFEKKLEKSGRSRFSLPRDTLYQEIYAFSLENQENIKRQLQNLGASCDWSRWRFMLEPPLVNTVYRTFKQLYDDGLVYRAKRPIHWCVKHQTTLSDLEVEDATRPDPIYYLRYGPLTVATVRPETAFGDVAIAVHPNDKRYRRYVGQTIAVTMADRVRELPVIADDYVNPQFGTGVVKITPAHDANDFAVATRHQLPCVEVIDAAGKLTAATGPYAGLGIAAARQRVVADLTARGLVVKVDPAYEHGVKVCYKCRTIIEPRVLDQWWLSLTRAGHSGKALGDLARQAVASGQTRFTTARFANQFDSWMAELQDWPLSRQIAWGIPLPVWYGPNGAVVVTDGATPEAAAELTRDPDVFDTWFSSCQWPFSTLGNHDGDLAVFYPTTAMMPGYDILFFWVARMMMLSIYTQGKTPYGVVCLHGLVRDKDRQKMSKSKGNVIDPLRAMADWGADAVRAALIFGNAPGTDPVITEEKIRGQRNFTTKLWNIARFVAVNKGGESDTHYTGNTQADRSIKQKLDQTVAEVSRELDNYHLHRALEAAYHFTWHELADKYVEAAKRQLQDDAIAQATRENLRFVFISTLTLLHPFLPFVTERLWREFHPSEGLLMNSSWPAPQAAG